MTIYLIRHATAGSRGPGANDLQRPLDAYGHLQAENLAELLGHLPIVELHSSEATRCQQTLGPLGAALDVPVIPAGPLLEGSSQARVMDFIRSFGDGRDVGLCSHGDIIPDVIRTLEVGGTRIDGERRCAKGSIWALTVDADERISSAHYTAVEPVLALADALDHQAADRPTTH